MQQFIGRLTDKKSQEFADQCGNFFSNAPHLPKKLTEFIVTITPIFVLIGAVLSLFSSPILGVLSIVSLLTLNPLFVISVLFAAVFALATSIILFFAYKPLRNREYTGWMLLFWSDVLAFVQTALSILVHRTSLWSLVGTFIGFYILYEMRPWYKKSALGSVSKSKKRK